MYVGDMTTVNVNLAGLPALVLRSLLRPDHPEDTYLPAGLQLIGSHFGERELLELGHIIEVCSRRSGREFPDSQFLGHIL
jgi:aspartyl-tRNA(Asn)/glutamyl-tRNA(Gln) amidotransferase subunit A